MSPATGASIVSTVDTVLSVASGTITATVSRLLPTGVPVIMVHGEFDRVMPPATGAAYAETVRRAGDRAEAITIPGAGHFEPVMSTSPAWETIAGLVARELARR